ncbi:MAG: hypothetical protein ACHQJ6_06650 [Candidatus Berkiellales bacterium]
MSKQGTKPNVDSIQQQLQAAMREVERLQAELRSLQQQIAPSTESPEAHGAEVRVQQSHANYVGPVADTGGGVTVGGDYKGPVADVGGGVTVGVGYKGPVAKTGYVTVGSPAKGGQGDGSQVAGEDKAAASAAPRDAYAPISPSAAASAAPHDAYAPISPSAAASAAPRDAYAPIGPSAAASAAPRREVKEKQEQKKAEKAGADESAKKPQASSPPLFSGEVKEEKDHASSEQQIAQLQAQLQEAQRQIAAERERRERADKELKERKEKEDKRESRRREERRGRDKKTEQAKAERPWSVKIPDAKSEKSVAPSVQPSSVVKAEAGRIKDKPDPMELDDASKAPKQSAQDAQPPSSASPSLIPPRAQFSAHQPRVRAEGQTPTPSDPEEDLFVLSLPRRLRLRLVQGDVTKEEMEAMMADFLNTNKIEDWLEDGVKVVRSRRVSLTQPLQSTAPSIAPQPSQSSMVMPTQAASRSGGSPRAPRSRSVREDAIDLIAQALHKPAKELQAAMQQASAMISNPGDANEIAQLTWDAIELCYQNDLDRLMKNDDFLQALDHCKASKLFDRIENEHERIKEEMKEKPGKEPKIMEDTPKRIKEEMKEKPGKEPKIMGDTPKDEEIDYLFVDLEAPTLEASNVIREINEKLKLGIRLREDSVIIFSSDLQEAKKQREQLALALKERNLVEIKTVSWQSMMDPKTEAKLEWAAKKGVRWVVEDKCKYKIDGVAVARQTFLTNYHRARRGNPFPYAGMTPEQRKEAEERELRSLGFGKNGKIPEASWAKRKLVKKLEHLGLLEEDRDQRDVAEDTGKVTRKMRWNLR